jgi:hypothetical protein
LIFAAVRADLKDLHQEGGDPMISIQEPYTYAIFIIQFFVQYVS